VGGNYTYIYRISSFDVSTKRAIGMAREIFEADSNYLINSQPNLINAYEGKSDIKTRVDDNNQFSKVKFYVTNANNSTLQVYYTLPEHYKNAQITIYDYYGHNVNAKIVKSGEGNVALSLSDLPSGFYIANIKSEKGEILSTQKFRVL